MFVQLKQKNVIVVITYYSLELKNNSVGITIKLCHTKIWKWNFQHKKPYQKKQKH